MNKQDKKITHLDYLKPLLRWLGSAENWVYAPPGRKDLECYGTGYNNWGVQTHQKAFAAYAVASTHPDFEEVSPGLEKDRLLERALKLLRFSLESHRAGSYSCTDGTRWGHTWISALGIERMGHGIEALWEFLEGKDIELIRKVFISECNWLMDKYYRKRKTGIPGEILAGKTEDNHPENNLWNGAFLHRTASMFPDAPRAEEYREKGTRFLMNSISVSGDAVSEAMIEGKPVKEWHAGANFFDSYALNHHGYLNVGYMVICLSNVSILHFYFKKRGEEPPPSLYHHAQELWKLVKMFTFSDGRLLRIGGDTRVRYCYCQDYGIPSWLLAASLFEDQECPSFEKEWLATVEYEQKRNSDGSFLRNRCKNLMEISPLYYTRLESDRAVNLSMGAYWRLHFNLPSRAKHEIPERTLSGSWHDEYHGAYMERTPSRIASWVWISAERPQGLLLPPGTSSLAEWRQNLAGNIKGTGKHNFQKVLSHGGTRFPGGFVTWGKTSAFSETMVAESQFPENTALHYTAFSALPDNSSIIAIQKAVNPRQRIFTRAVKGIFLQIPNDIFNDNRRKYFFENGSIEAKTPPGTEETIELKSSWVNIDNKLFLARIPARKDLTIFRPKERQIGIKKYPAEEHPFPGGMLYADELCAPCLTGLKSFNAGDVLYETSFMMRPLNRQDSIDFSQRENFLAPEASPGICAAACLGADNIFYMLVYNPEKDTRDASIKLPGRNTAVRIPSNEKIKVGANGILEVRINAEEASLFIID